MFHSENLHLIIFYSVIISYLLRIFLSDIEFEELKQKLEDNKVTLIDVRVPRELHKVGKIPKSKNIICMYEYSLIV